ncbi:MAG: hypothetical protein AAF515_02745 [Pseudomonadota bacterium]
MSFLGALCCAVGALVGTSSAWAIDPGIAITNQAIANFTNAGTGVQITADATVITDPAAGNSPPYGVDPLNFSVPENAPGAVLGTLSALDVDSADTHSFSTTDPRFSIVGDQLSLAPGRAFDFETDTAVTLPVVAEDAAGAAFSGTLTVTITDVNEAPTMLVLDNLTVAPGVPGVGVGNLSVVDPDAGDSHTYSVDNPRFAIVGAALELAPGEALAPGETLSVTVTATDTGGLDTSETFSISAPGGASGIAVQFETLVGGGTETVPTTACASAPAGPFTPRPATTRFDSSALAFPLAGESLGVTSVFSGGDTLFVRVFDATANVAAGVVDTLDVTVAAGAESEVLRLTETAPNSGEFLGYVQASGAITAPGDCGLYLPSGATIAATYTRAPGETATAAALIDPAIRVFDAASGVPIDGVTVRLIDVLTGAPATVFGSDGAPWPAEVVSGGAVGGVDFPAGVVLLPRVAPDTYSVEIDGVNRFAFPSAAADAALQALPGAPYALGPGARGMSFDVVVPGPFRLDLPLDVISVPPTVASGEILRGNPTGGAMTVSDPVGQCLRAGSPDTLPPPLDAEGKALPASDLALDLAASGEVGAALFAAIEDPDQDLDPFVRDTVEVAVTSLAGGDSEMLIFTETAPSSGLFVGYVPTDGNLPGTPGDCVLAGAAGQGVRFEYVDPNDPSDRLTLDVVLDPLGLVFNSATGELVNGAIVRLLDADTGLPASVFEADGSTPHPADVISGGGGGLAPAAVGPASTSGTFLFPRVPAGRYRLVVEPPDGLVFPSTAADAALTGFFPAPFERGANFELFTMTAVGGTVPLDPVDGQLIVEKLASRERVAVGDVLQYRVTVRNPTVGRIGALALSDLLPEGLRLVPKSVRLNDAAAEFDVDGTGRALGMPLPDLDGGAEHRISYVVEVTPGTAPGQTTNIAWVDANGLAASNRGEAAIEIEEDLLGSFSTIVGEVLVGQCDAPVDELQGVEGVRILLEDGTYVLTDADGRYHFEGIKPGSHVVQLESSTLPRDLELITCETNNRRPADADEPSVNQFVDLRPGSMWRADFRVFVPPVASGPLQAQLKVELDDAAGELHYTYALKGSAALPLSRFSVTALLDDGLAFVPGSARWQEAPIAPSAAGLADGVVSLRLPDVPGEFTGELRFRTRLKETSQRSFTTRVASRVRAGAKSRQLKAVSATLSLDAPGQLAQRASASADGVTGRVLAPGSGTLAAVSDVAIVELKGERVVYSDPDNLLPDVDRGDPPDFGQKWLAGQGTEAEFVWPLVDANPAVPALLVALRHAKGERPNLLVNGVLVDPITFERTVVNRDRGNAVSVWKNVVVRPGPNTLSAQLEDSDGAIVASATREVWLSGAPVRAELDLEESNLVADGITPPVVAVRLFDRSGRPARPGMTGEFSLAPPYSAFDENKSLSQLSESSRQGLQRYLVRRAGLAYIALEPTSLAGEVQLRFGFDRLRQEEIRARLKPVAREWVLVGLAEGTLSLDTLAPHLESYDGEDPDGVVTDGRVAFYAKGQIKGEWLLTLGYDNDRDTRGQFRNRIDPNRFYTLYGDGAQQAFDADTTRQLYLKLERDTVMAMLGDFDTGFDRTELTRYARRMNGAQAEYYGKQFEASAFAANTDQGFYRDTIQGDGTSGIYRLSRGGLTRNSERVEIVVRDRFAPDRVLERLPLTGFIDYSIDYIAGTLLFKRPIASQDEAFNPQFIEVEYEVEGQKEELVTGARVSYVGAGPGNEIGLTYVHDDSAGVGGDLAGVDAEWQLSDRQELIVEAAATERDAAIGGSVSGEAYRAELRHNGERVAGTLFFRDQDGAFGLGQQVALAGGIRRYGVQGEWKPHERLRVEFDAERQEDKGSGGERDIAGVEANWRPGVTELRAGARIVNETAASGVERTSEQLLAGAGREFLDGRLSLRADGELALDGDGTTDFPSRAIAGAEYRFAKGFSLFAEQELTFGGERDTQDTRVGLRGQPWLGADVHTRVDRSFSENGERLFATTGLLQQFRVGDAWLLDLGVDRVKTLRQSQLALDGPGNLTFSPQLPAASGSFGLFSGSNAATQLASDFTAGFVGAAYRREQWDASARAEYHAGDVSDKLNLLLGLSHQLKAGNIFSLSGAFLRDEQDSGVTREFGDLRFGMALRPTGSRWTVLSRLDLNLENLEDGTFDTRTRKLVHNLNANYKRIDPDKGFGWELSLRTGAKWVRDRIDDDHYGGFTGLAGLSLRRDLSPRWAAEVHGAGVYAEVSDTLRFSAGAELSRSFLREAWLGVGYNVVGFADDDFVAADYTRQGPYVRLRVKLDQSSVRRFVGRLRGRLPAVGGTQNPNP